MNQRAAPVAVAIDVGGTSIKGQLLDSGGRAVAALDASTPVTDGPDVVIAAVRRMAVALAELSGDHEIVAAGVVVPGFVDPAAGIARYAANIGWRDVPMRALVESDLGRPVVLEHDVRAAALAERVLGRARGADHCAVVIIGTGAGAVLVADGRELRGASGQAGELGHVLVRPGGEPCGCGQRGCLEAYASAGAIARRYARAAAPLTTKQIVGRLATDVVAAEIWRDAVEALSTGLIALIMVQDPSLIVLGGGLSEAGDALLAPVRAAVEARVGRRGSVMIQLSSLRSIGGRLGAAILAWRRVGVSDFGGWSPAHQQISPQAEPEEARHGTG